MFLLIFDKKAARFLASLQKPLAIRIYKKLETAKADPFRYFERLAGRTDYKLRVGDYRAIADINAGLQRIDVTKIGHRKNVYE